MKNLLKTPLQTFKPYVTGKPIEEVRRDYGLTGRISKLASNENPLGTSPKALEAMHRALDNAWLYPDDNAFYLRQKVAEKFGVTIENVFPACGSVEVIELLGTAFLNPADVVVTSDRTFAVYGLITQKAGARLKTAPMIDGGYRYDLPAIARLVDDQTKIVFLANPTNPTGTWFTKAEFDSFMDKVPEETLVIYDSAYDEYCTATDMPDPMEHFRRGRRIMILRTLSKAYGLAGMRIGFGIAPAEVVKWLMTAKLPFNTSVVAQAGAIAALDDEDFLRRTKEHNTTELGFLRTGLARIPVTVPPSQTNFLLIDTKKDAQWMFHELQKQGVIIRPLGAYGMPGAIRVSTGLREDNEAFLKHFRELIYSKEGYFQSTST